MKATTEEDRRLQDLLTALLCNTQDEAQALADDIDTCATFLQVDNTQDSNNTEELRRVYNKARIWSAACRGIAAKLNEATLLLDK